MDNQRKEEIKQFKIAILIVARQLAAKNGWEKVSMRNIAYELNISAPLLYTYFKNKNEILRALENQGFEELNKKLKTVRKNESNPTVCINRMVSEIFEYASISPEMYQVMFNLEGVKCDAAKKKLIKNTFRNFEIVIDPVSKKNSNLAMIWWSMTHGYISLLMTDQLQLSTKKAKKSILNLSDQLQKLLNT